MEENKKYIIINEYNEKNEIEAHKIINRNNLLVSRLMLIVTPILIIVYGIRTNQYTVASIGFLGLLIFCYMIINLEKIQLKSLNKRIAYKKNKPDKFTFYDSYYSFEKNDVNSSKFGRLSYDHIKCVYITDNIYILKSANVVSIIYNNGFEVGIKDEFDEFLKEKLGEKIIEL